MNDLVVIYGLTIVFVCALGLLLVLYRYVLGNKLTRESQKLQAKMASIRRDFPHFEQNPKEFIGQNIGELGIDGLLDELGIPSMFKPLAKGFIDKIAQNPEIIASYAEKLGIKLPGGKNGQENEGTDLL